MENKWVSCPMKTALSAGRNMKQRQGPLLLFHVFICHISIKPCFYCGGVFATSTFPKETHDIHRCLYACINGPCLLQQQRAICTMQSDNGAALNILKVSFKHVGRVVTEAVIHKQRQMFFL